ncbi:DUF4239 domain-containing protein [Noviluteimonas gilva]|uniref:DUF4239 domain-containing protein n=1 Tax=Noviluteimonas gilva TaxID=2682097 RepID=A0A7C9HMP3_9GAMM|nr:DUF4239 domain-containing protein [Lysobacter gilvus]MUV14697.1 DUF4239 domain-containing protein [Lysobacter gilvus]
MYGPDERYLHIAPWLLALCLFVALLAARELGYAIRRRTRTDKADDDDVFAMTSVLGLLALFIGFTFSIALDRYEHRRALVVAEANALGTTWLRTSLVDAPDRDRMRAVLRAYVATRVDYGNASDPRAEADAWLRTERLQGTLWETVVHAVGPFRDTPRASLLVTTTNESIDLAAERFATRQSHVPPRILRLLATFALISAAMVGFQRGRQRNATTLLFVLLTLAIALVLDLDRPTAGLTNVPQQPMLDLQRSMQGT